MVASSVTEFEGCDVRHLLSRAEARRPSRYAEGIPHAARGPRRWRDRAPGGGLLLPVARLPRQGRAQPRPLRPRVRRGVQGHRRAAGRNRGRDPRGLAAARLLAAPERGGQGAHRGARRLGEDHGDAEEASRRAEGAPRRRQQVDRHRRHLALRRLRLQSGRRAHRPEGKPPPPRDQGMGQARVQGSRREGRDRHAQHQGGAAPSALVRALRRGRGARSFRHHPRHGREGLPRHPHGCRSGTTP